MFGIRHEEVQKIKNDYPAGTRVQLVHMADPYVKIPVGTKGTVQFVDEVVGTIHVQWDNGCTLGILYREDECERLPEEA